jgi:1-acyl-sn-glycerol-3-phosphate acyltransferase
MSRPVTRLRHLTSALRSIAFIVFEVTTVVPWALACLLWAPLPRPMRYYLTMGWVRMQLWALRWIVGIRWQVRGRENLVSEPLVLLSKHQSTWETFFYPAFMPRELCFVFKRELLYLPFFGWGIWLLDMIHIDRGRASDAFESVVRQGSEKLAQGRWIIMFPEGTRTAVGTKGRYRSGGARLAVRTGARVVPIAVNSGECWPRKAFVLHPGLITVSIGAPITTQGRSADEVHREVQQWIEAEMRVLSPHRYRSAPSARSEPTAA